MPSSQVIEGKNKNPILDCHFSDDCSDNFSVWLSPKKVKMLLGLVDDMQEFVDEYGDEVEASPRTKMKVLKSNSKKTTKKSPKTSTNGKAKKKKVAVADEGDDD